MGLAYTYFSVETVCTAGASSASHMQGCAVRLADGLTGYVASIGADGMCEVQPWSRDGQPGSIPSARSVVGVQLPASRRSVVCRV